MPGPDFLRIASELKATLRDRTPGTLTDEELAAARRLHAALQRILATHPSVTVLLDPSVPRARRGPAGWARLEDLPS